jgi:hypothetical protein
MRSLKISLILAVAVPAAAQAEGPYHIKRDGMEFEYTAITRANGVRELTGTNLRTGEDFSLRVNGRMVSGTMGNTQVSFRVPSSARPKRVEVLASR